MKQTIDRIMLILDKKEKNKIVYLVLLMVVGGFLELLGVAGILPLISAITTGQVSDITSIVYLAIALMVIYVIKNLFLIYMYNSIYKFVFDGRSKLSTKLFEVYMREPYAFHLGRNQAIIQRAVRSDVDGFYHLVRSLLQLLSELIICAVLAGLLLCTDFYMALLLMALLTICVGTVVIISKKKVKKLGAEDMEYNGKMNQWIMQGIGGIKEVRLLGTEDYFVDSFSEYSAKSSTNQRKQQVLVQLPRLLTETVSIGAVLLWIVVAALSKMDLLAAVPTLAVFAVAAFRLLPSVGKINGLLTEYHFYRPRADFIYEDLEGAGYISSRVNSVKDYADKNDSDNESNIIKNKIGNKVSNKEDAYAISLKESIKLSGVSFSYENTDKKILDDANLTIMRGESVGFVGPSGAGKTTLVDVIMGLLSVQSGSITVDGQDIYDNLSGWYRCLGYVPQSIYLSDDTIRRNIAFGIRDEDIDDEKIARVIVEARLSELVQSLKDGVDTVIGDRGVRLSGGQRQRIGIARALYTSPEVLILDEATSSLDNDTEAAVMEAIEALHGKVTMIVVAHRLTTIENCDRVYKVENGSITPN